MDVRGCGAPKPVLGQFHNWVARPESSKGVLKVEGSPRPWKTQGVPPNS